MSEPVYKTSYKVRIADANTHAHLKLTALFEMLQEAATEHAQKLGVDFGQLQPLGLGWVLSKMSIELEKLPMWNERVFIKTWPSVRDRITTCREFVAQDANKARLFTARSQWAIFDIRTRRLARLDKIRLWDKIDDKFANNSTFEKHLRRPSPEAHGVRCYTRKDDIDLNGHVNNSVYIALALQPVPTEFVDAHEPKRIQIAFLEEIRPEDTVLSKYEQDASTTVHSIINDGTGRECARINIDWTAAKGEKV